MVDIRLVSLAGGLIDAFNNADWPRLSEGLLAEVVYAEIGTARQAQGIDACLKLLQAWKCGFPDAVGIVRNAVSDGNTVVQEIVWSGTHAGRLVTPDGVAAATGRSVEVQATLWIMFQGNKAARVHHYLDMHGMLNQIRPTAVTDQRVPNTNRC